jgi:LPXTG-motif cell wall-anchored protein
MTKVESTEVSVADDKYEIKMKDKEGNILDIYTIDPETAEGTNSAGEIVSLPQTGNNSMMNVLVVVGAFMMIAMGLYAVIVSGNSHRKKEEQ